MAKKGIVKIHGKEYKTVALRVNEFCEHKPDWHILTDLVHHDDKRVIMKAIVIDDKGNTVGSGYAEEVRSQSAINKTSALECAETSAIGRALASIGLGGEEYASADEVLRAIEQQKVIEKEDPIVRTQDDAAAESEAPPDDDGPWGNEIPDDILDVVKENINIATTRIGKEEYQIWHKRVLSNFFSAESISDLSKEQLAEFAEHQNDKIKFQKEK
jgi:hypothetical protein